MSINKNIYEEALSLANDDTADLEKVFELLEKSLDDEGDPRAAYALGSWYIHGKYVDKNYRKAAQLFRQGAKKNNSKCLYNLAICYENGAGLKQNERLAFENYLQAALNGDEQSFYEVGRCYYYGIGTEKNRRLSRIWLDRAKELGIED